jgi:ribosomal protein S18 acetylase RimI-like enzyme
MSDPRLFKRYRLEVRLRRSPWECVLPPGFGLLAWSEELVDVHAEVMRRSFADADDVVVFPNLGSATGCGLLMRAIRDSDDFCPGATWLVGTADGCVGTIQGLFDSRGRTGAIQNVGVLPGYRGVGLGRALVARALAGFLAAGAGRVYLEVTAGNDPAERLYRGLGFRHARTFYRAAPAAVPDAVGAGI